MAIPMRLQGTAAMALLLLASVTRAQDTLDAGVRYGFTPADTQCYTHTSGKGSEVLVVLEASCNNNTGRADINAATNGSLRALDLDARVRFQKWIRIAEVPGAGDQSLIPVQIRFPRISWNLNLFNDVILEFFGRASADIVLTVRENPAAEDPDPANAAARGTIVAQQPLLTVSHGGIGGGCLVSSSATVLAADPFGLAASVFSCVASAPNIVRQTGAADLVVMMQPGRTYNIELELLTTASKRVNAPQNLNFVSVRSSPGGANEDPPGLQWSSMVITVGTDAQAVVADLKREVDELRELLRTHTHEYLTGKGNGHNNTVAQTSTLLQELVPEPAGLEPGLDAQSDASLSGGTARPAGGGGGASMSWLQVTLLLLSLGRRRRGPVAEPDGRAGA